MRMLLAVLSKVAAILLVRTMYVAANAEKVMHHLCVTYHETPIGEVPRLHHFLVVVHHI